MNAIEPEGAHTTDCNCKCRKYVVSSAKIENAVVCDLCFSRTIEKKKRNSLFYVPIRWLVWLCPPPHPNEWHCHSVEGINALRSRVFFLFTLQSRMTDYIRRDTHAIFRCCCCCGCVSAKVVCWAKRNICTKKICKWISVNSHALDCKSHESCVWTRMLGQFTRWKETKSAHEMEWTPGKLRRWWLQLSDSMGILHAHNLL